MSESHLIKELQILLGELDRLGFLDSIYRPSLFYDEPRWYKFITQLNFLKKYSDGYPYRKYHLGMGFSFNDQQLALIKSLGEAIERLALYSFDKEDFIFLNENQPIKTMDLSNYKNIERLYIKQIAWVKGKSLIDETDVLVPAQIVFLNYLNNHREKSITTKISTGASGGFSQSEAILRGIYEVMERDCFMTIYLNKISVPKIRLVCINNKILKKIVSDFSRYNLELNVFDISNDLAVPCFMTIIIDRTGVGPIISLGLKCDLNPEKAIVGSIEEAYAGRNYPRKLIIEHKTNTFNINPNKIKSMEDRMLFWLNPRNISKLDFLLEVKATDLSLTNVKKYTVQEELELLKTKLKNKGFEVFFVDITMNILKKSRYFICKVIIPKLQPLYFDESKKDINKSRLNAVADFFHLKRRTINKFPHPLI